MKKFITTTALVIVSALLLVSCSNPPIPSKVDRWETPETLNYEVKMVKELVEGSTTLYKPYYLNKPGATIAPDEAEGSYVTAITNTDGVYTLKSTLSVKESYLKTNLPENYATLAPDIMTSETDTTVTFTSKTESVVSFLPFPQGSPKSSTKTINGVYIYRGVNLESVLIRNNYQVTTTYGEKAASVKSDFNHFNKATNLYDLPDEKIPQTFETTLAAATYDNEQLYFIARAFNLDTLVTSGSQTVNIYNASLQKTQPIMIGNASNGEVKVTINGVEYKTYQIGAQINVANKTGSAQIMYFEKDNEMLAGTSGKIKTFKMVKMTMGHLTFTLAA